MIFTAYRNGNSRIDVFYDPIKEIFTVRNEKGDLIKDAAPFKDYIDYIATLSEWKQLDFKSTAKLDQKRNP